MDESQEPVIDTRRRALGAGLVALAVSALARGAESEPASDTPAPARGLYTVEIVVFRSAVSAAAAGEDLAAATHDTAGDSDSAGGGPRSVRLETVLPSTHHRLNDVASRLNASGSRKVVAHVAWTQTASAYNSGSSLTAEQVGLSAAGITGQVQLERGTYLHLGFSLIYTAPGGTRYALSEVRRVKFAERNYYDHPAMGIIALVTPGG